MRTLGSALVILGLLWAPAATVQADNVKKFSITGVNYTKWLWGNQRLDGGLYNYSDVPGEGYGDNGQGTELELLVSARPSKKIEVKGRMKARFNQNFWTNFGGFGGGNVGTPGTDECLAGDCGEFDSRSAQYIKFRGLSIIITPGYKWVDTVTIGSSDFGMFDPFTIGKIRYIDRDNGAGLIFQGSSASRKFSYDFTRVSLPRLWAGPDFSTGDYNVSDAAYALQLKFNPSSKFDLAVIGEYVNDIEIDATDFDFDDGRDIRTRFRNSILGLRFGIHPNPKVDLKGAFYSSTSDAVADFSSSSFFGISGFSPVPAGKHDDVAYTVDLAINDPFDNGLSFNVQVFDIGAEFVSVMAARRESDVLLTEGHDGAFGLPGPSNSAFGVFSGEGNETRIGYGGWQGNAQQVVTINADNAFTDFDEPMAESVIGWKGFTIQPVLGLGDFDLTGEYTSIDYNTNWQAWGDPTRGILDSLYPNMESDAGFGSPRNSYAPFQDKETEIMVLAGKYFVDVGNGLELFGKVKFIDEQDKRMNDARFLPFQAGDCPGGGAACANNRNEYSAGLSSADLYGNPPVITVNGVTGYQWKPFDSLADDDRDMDYKLYQIGAGYQITDEIYGTITYEHYDVDLQDGNTAFQAYQLHEMASGDHTKDKLIIEARYNIGGAEFGFNYEYNTGDFTPDFGGGFVTQFADEATAANVLVPVGSPGFAGRFGGWNSLAKRDFEHQRLKAFLKVFF
ncbi:MAG: hypothetical protein AAF560_25655 [Acidobacteriota bacterium]